MNLAEEEIQETTKEMTDEESKKEESKKTEKVISITPMNPDAELPEDMIALYESTFENLEEGAIVVGTIVAINKDGVLLDIGYKAEGDMSFDQFSPDERKELKIGDSVKVYLEERENSEGALVLSKEKADKIKVWESLEAAYLDNTPVTGTIFSRIKGGMIVDIGVKAFLPGSQIDLRPVRDMDSLIGKKIEFRLLKMNHKRGNIVVSRRAILEEQRDTRKKDAISNLIEGNIIPGIVKNITEYGVFLDLGGIDGLLHITDISWGRVNHPSEMFTISDSIDVMVLKYDKDSGRVSLGLKQKFPDPWSDIDVKYPEGSKVGGKVVSIADYGVFMEISPGIEGLVHISEMTWTKDIKHPSKIVSTGDMIEAVVLSLDKKNRKISLGMKQAGENPWDIISEKYPVGTKIQGVIRNITDFGVFVGIPEGVDGLIHISDISWTKHIKHPSEAFKKGQEIEAIVLRIDKSKGKLSLGYKQLIEDPWTREIPEKYKVGVNITGEVVKVADFGIFLKLEEDIQGLVHISELSIDPQKKISEVINIGEELTAKIIKVDPGDRKISLSAKAYELEAHGVETDEDESKE